MLTSQRMLVAALAGLVMIGLLIATGVAEQSLRRDQLTRTTRSLETHSVLLVDRVGASGANLPTPELQALVKTAGDAVELRVTIIDDEGVVLADSRVPPARLPGVANHANRPEVREALTGEVGTARRRSETVGVEYLYLARPVPGGVLRVASEFEDLQPAIASLRRQMLFWGGGGLLLFVACSYGISQLSLRPLREMRRAAASIAEGHLDDRLPLDPGDELRGISMAVNQIAEQLRLRLEEVTNEKEQLRAVLEGMVEAMLVVDPKRNVLLANSRLRELFGVTGEIVGRPILEAIRDRDLDTLLREVAETDEVRTCAMVVGTAPQRSLRVQAARFPAEGVRVGTVVVFHDMTEIERLEKVRRDFVANASHELRTPLTAIHGFAETLMDGQGLSDDERRSYLEVIDRHARRLGSIVNDLLELSTIETGKLRLEPTGVDVADVVASVIRDLEARCAERDLSLERKVEGPTQAFADPTAVEQVVINLLDNAVKYTEPGGAIEVSIEGDGGRVHVAVRDSGIGIPEEDLARIFERFYRVDKARSRSLGGTGLGLSIVKHLVQGMGGEIAVESELGQGSVFRFSLPASAAAS